MGKVSKRLSALLRLTTKTTKPDPVRKPPNICWCFVKRNNNNSNDKDDYYHNQAVVRLAETRDSAAVKIQSHFRAYLSRRALRALKSLVKLQALVRGHIVRKQTANNIQALLRVQANARARRSNLSESQLIFYSHALFMQRNDSSSDEKIVDGQVFNPDKRHLPPKRRNNIEALKESLVHRIAPNKSPVDFQSLAYLNIFQNPEGGYYDTTFTPIKRDRSRSSLGGLSEHPHYMLFTESSKAKMRSLSAPKQRMQYERSSSARRDYSNRNRYDFKFNSQKVSELQAKFANKLYPGSGHMERLGVATRGDHLHRV